MVWDLTFEETVNLTKASTSAATTAPKTIRLGPEDLGRIEMSDCGLDFHFVSLSTKGAKKFEGRRYRFLECGKLDFKSYVWIYQFNEALATFNQGQIRPLPESLSNGEPLVSHTMNTDMGSSGAPIFNENGEVVAIHCKRSYKMRTKKSLRNLAVKISAVLNFLEEKILGVETSSPVDDALHEMPQVLEDDFPDDFPAGIYETTPPNGTVQYCLESRNIIYCEVLN